MVTRVSSEIPVYKRARSLPHVPRCSYFSIPSGIWFQYWKQVHGVERRPPVLQAQVPQLDVT